MPTTSKIWTIVMLFIALMSKSSYCASELLYKENHDDFCAFKKLEPPYYVAYKAPEGSIQIDGSIDEPAWKEVAWTAPNQDICGPNNCSRGEPRFLTKQKVRWDDKYIYFAAYLEETHDSYMGQQP